MLTCGDFIGISKAAGSKIIKQVSRAVAELNQQYVNFPNTEEERNAVAQKFHNISKFPRVLGAIDCTHVRIQSPGGEDAEIFRNRKGFFSINVQAVCDADLRIQSIVARWPGSAHDSIIYQNSRVQARFENGEFGDFLLLGDSGYAISRHLLTPLRAVHNQAEDLYNESLIRTRNTVERCFGVLKRRFPVLAMGIRVKITTVQSIIVATAVLHNIALFHGVRMPRVTREEEILIRETLFNGVPLDAGEDRHNPREIRRNELINYFNSRLNVINNL